ncbi:UNVERIFIED_CONTAM: hypothetical protein HDU68_001663 [Siphonaria sp. JEL0065]|nr:hypothetical protein HDU68_001663 [Siphonaria sp. JEL0065]
MSSVGTASLFIGFILVGPFYDRFQVFPTMTLSAFCFGTGFLGIYLAYIGVLKGVFVSIGAVSFYYFVAGMGSCACFMVCYGVNLSNFPQQYAGLVSGTLDALAISIYSQVHSRNYATDVEGFLLFVTLSVFLINLAAAYTITKSTTQIKTTPPTPLPRQPAPISDSMHLQPLVTSSQTLPVQRPRSRLDSTTQFSLYQTKASTIHSSVANSSLWQFEQPISPVIEDDLYTKNKYGTITRNTITSVAGTSLDFRKPIRAIDTVSGLRAVELSDFGVSLQSPRDSTRMSGDLISDDMRMTSMGYGGGRGLDVVSISEDEDGSSVDETEDEEGSGGLVSIKNPSELSGLESTDFRMPDTGRRNLSDVVELESPAVVSPGTTEHNLVYHGELERGQMVVVEGSRREYSNPQEILKSLVFWLLAISYIWQQGIVYFNNIGSVVRALFPVSESDSILSQQLTILSISQVLGRITVGPGSDYIIKRFPSVDRSLFHLICQTLVLLPFALLATLPEASITLPILTFASCVIGYTFGGIWVVYPPMLTEFFGLKFYGTASGFVMFLIPVGIFVSQILYGNLYDKQSEGGAGLECVGVLCFQTSFLVFLGFQCVCVAFSGLLVWRRMKKEK